MQVSLSSNGRLIAGLFFALLLCLGVRSAEGQSFTVSGTVSGHDLQGVSPLPGATAVLLSLPDSVMVHGASTDSEGRFALRRVEPGAYVLVVSFIGYRRERRSIEVDDRDVAGLEVTLRYDALELDGVDVTARRPRVETDGDTTLFNADAFRTRPDATAEELVTRMPGFTVEEGRVLAQGEDVRRVLVDGDEFFGDDAVAALRNLPAEIIDQIAVFDQMSDQARFTGFDDGNTQRVIDVRTRRGMSNGRFGRVSSAYGSDSRYLGTGNMNLFDGARRISIVGMGNNVNQQNFASEDLLGIAQASGGPGGGRFGGMRMRGSAGGGPGPGSFRGGPGWGGGLREFMVGQQSGISSVYSLGVNYIDRWGDSWRVNGSYFFNRTDNVNDQNLDRLYLTGFAADQRYHEDGLQSSENYNHRLNMRMEYTIDENNSLVITPRLSFQQNESNRLLQAYTLDEAAQLVNTLNSTNRSHNAGYVLSNSILYRHRFGTRGRTFSANLRTDADDRTGERYQFDEGVYYDEFENRIATDRETEVFTGGYTVSAELSYTEPVGERGQLMLSYQPSLNRNTSVQDAFLFDDTAGTYADLDTSLSNRYRNMVTTQRAQAGYRLRGERYNADVRLAWQHTGLDGRQTFPFLAETSQSWQNMLPGATLQYRFENGTNLRISYDTRTRTPSARQLQNVIDDTDPLRLSTGNPDLRQQYEHTISTRFRMVNAERATSNMAFVSAGFTQDYIGNRTFVAQRDSILQGGIVLGRGARLVSPDNLGSAYSLRSFAMRSMPFDLIRSNFSINGGVMFTRSPSVIDGARGFADNLSLNSGVHVSSKLSERVDFRVAYQAGYNIARNTINPESDGNYYSGRLIGGLNVVHPSGILFSTDLNMRHFEGLGADYNRNSIYWNVSVGYRFLTNNAAEVRLTALDLLGRNDDITRSIYDDYIEDYRSNVLGRYAMVTFSYNFRAFAGGRGR